MDYNYCLFVQVLCFFSYRPTAIQVEQGTSVAPRQRPKASQTAQGSAALLNKPAQLSGKQRSTTNPILPVSDSQGLCCEF